MTDEQILQNAEEYYDKLDSITIEVENEPNSIVDAYIAGAHSRDEEIKELKKLLFEKECDIQFLEHKLRNPWISVEDRLPEEGQSVTVLNDYGDKGYNHCVCTFKDGKFVVVFTNLETGETQDLENNYVTHWMPIPELKKGE